MHQRADGLKVAGAFAAIYVLWGGTYLAIALGLQSIPAFILIASRSLIGGGVLLLLSYFRGSELRPLGDWGHAAVGGAFLFMGCHGAIAYAQRQVPSGLSAVLLATIPFWIVLVNVVIARSEPLGKLLGLLPGFTGVALIAWHETSSSTRPLSWTMMLLLLASALSWAVGSVYSQRRAAYIPSDQLAGMQANLRRRRLTNPQHDCRRVDRNYTSPRLPPASKLGRRHRCRVGTVSARWAWIRCTEGPSSPILIGCCRKGLPVVKPTGGRGRGRSSGSSN
jgi:hypothetical protein